MLNEKAREIYKYIRSRIDDGYAPTVREICAALGIRSTSTAHRYINLLVEEGYLDKMDNQNRAIRLHGKSAVNVPLIGTVTAGQPITAIENITDYLSYVPERRYTGELFALRVRGESMINAGILDGDIVVVEQSDVAENGEITGFKMRCEKSKLTTVKALQSMGFETIASGDSFNDLGMIRASKAGFLFKSTDKIKAAADGIRQIRSDFLNS